MAVASETQKMMIATPDKVARILEKVAANGIPLIIRPLACPNTAVKGRAIPSSGPILSSGIRVGNISEKGMKFLAEQSSGLFQVEFVLTSAKVTFQSRLVQLNRQDCVLSAPGQLISIERRKNSRYQVTGNVRAFMSFQVWDPSPSDMINPPFWDSTKEIGTLVPVADVALGGVSLMTRFPGICKILDRGQAIESGQLHLPMMGNFPVDVSVRWCKRLRESMTESDGKSRVQRLYKFGLQFVNLSQDLEKNIHIFIQRISQADAI
jgi:hypothetical protein